MVGFSAAGSGRWDRLLNIDTLISKFKPLLYSKLLMRADSSDTGNREVSEVVCCFFFFFFPNKIYHSINVVVVMLNKSMLILSINGS